MGTRADFYMGVGVDAEWLGSIAWDGNPVGIPDSILNATDAWEFRAAVAVFVAEREDGTTPDMGWPWPWDDSRMTDYAYIFDLDLGQVFICNFGEKMAMADEPDKWYPIKGEMVFPDMSERMDVTLGPRSGLIILTGGVK